MVSLELVLSDSEVLEGVAEGVGLEGLAEEVGCCCEVGEGVEGGSEGAEVCVEGVDA